MIRLPPTDESSAAAIIHVEPAPTAESTRAPPEGVAAEDEPDNQTDLSYWRFVPSGMIPVIGQRTKDQNRYTGMAPRSTDLSWRTMPFNVGIFAGGIDGEPLVRGHVNQAASFFGGLHYGWDYDYHWGIDRQIGYAPLRLSSANGSNSPRHGDAVFGEFRLLYYPWGDNRLRPYVVGGAGLSDLRFMDDQNNRFRRSAFVGSLGAGIKYLCCERIALQVEISDLVIPESGLLSTVNNLTLVSGVEFRFGLPTTKKHKLLGFSFGH
jgi:hypothetical protein